MLFGVFTAELKPPLHLFGVTRLSRGPCGCWKLSHLHCCLYRYYIVVYKACSGLSRQDSLTVVTGLVIVTGSLQVKVILSYTEVKRVCVYGRNSFLLNLDGWPSLAIKKVCGQIAWVGISFIYY